MEIWFDAVRNKWIAFRTVLIVASGDTENEAKQNFEKQMEKVSEVLK